MTDRYKLVHFHELDVNYWELFDLKTDPRELRSVYGEPEFVRVVSDLKQNVTLLRADLKVPELDPADSMIQPLAEASETPAGAKHRSGWEGSLKTELLTCKRSPIPHFNWSCLPARESPKP